MATALTTVAGEPTELHQISVAECLLNVVIIPGNPGALFRAFALLSAPPLVCQYVVVHLIHSADAICARRHVWVLCAIYAALA